MLVLTPSTFSSTLSSLSSNLSNLPSMPLSRLSNVLLSDITGGCLSTGVTVLLSDDVLLLKMGGADATADASSVDFNVFSCDFFLRTCDLIQSRQAMIPTTSRLAIAVVTPMITPFGICSESVNCTDIIIIN